MNIEKYSSGYVPKQAIIVHVSRDNHYYLESHRLFYKENGEIQLLEGRPLQKATIQGIVNSLAKENPTDLKCKGLLPDNLLYFEQSTDNPTLMWYIPAKKHYLHFTGSLAIPSGEAYTPSLIFLLKNKTLHIYSYKTSGKPSPTTKLYKAPFHNVGDFGVVCLGNATRPKNLKTFDEALMSWEKIWWNTEFSAIHGTPISGNLNLLWKKLIRTGEKFPKSVLIPGKYSTLNKLINAIN